MLEGLVAWVLNNYLGKYVENLNTDQLSIAILSGEVELENLPLRRDALRHLGIPIEIRAGHIGKVKLQIPIRSLRSSPWVIVIEQLYLVAGPLALDEWDQAAEELANQERKLAALDAIEACWRLESDGNSATGNGGGLTSGDAYYASSYTSWLNYGTGVITDIVENMQLHVNDVHIRYEDATSLRGGACACGLTIESLSVQSCDSLWMPQFTTHRDGSDLSYKSIELRNLAIYWDAVNSESDLTGHLPASELAAALAATSKQEHRYLVAPVSACARLQTNRSELPLRSASTPRIVCDLRLDQVPLALVDWQYEQMVSCTRGLEYLSRVQEHRRRRPSVSVSTDPKSWWMYAVTCNAPEICRKRTAVRTWSECLARARQNVRYVEMYTRLLAQPSAALGAESKRLKDTVEWSRDFDELRALREVAMRRVPCPSTPQQSSATSPVASPTEETQTQSSGRSVLVRWFPQWWGWYSSEAPSEQLPTIGTGTRQLEDEILEALADSAKNNTLLRRDVVFGRFNFSLNSGILELRAGNLNSENEGVPMLELQFSELVASVVSRPRSSSHGIELSLGDLCLRDKLTNGTLFPILVGPPGTRYSSGTSGTGFVPSGTMLNVPRFQQWRNIGKQQSTRRLFSDDSINDTIPSPLFHLIYESTSTTVRRVHVRSRPLDVIYQPAAVQWLIEFLCAPHQRSTARHRLEEMRARTRQQLTDTWGNMLEGTKENGTRGSAGIGERTSWDLRLDISAPQVILVERFCDPTAIIAVIDLGTLRLENGGYHLQQQQKSAQQQQQQMTVKQTKSEKQSPDDDEEDDEAFMTPCSTPPGSEIGDGNASVPESGTLTSALSELSLHQRLYDTYSIELSDIQVLVGRVRDNWRHAHTKGSSTLHVLDRFNISLQIERRIVPTSDPMYPSVTLAANLPRLVAHVNESKIAALRTLTKVIGNVNLPSPFSSASTPPGEDNSLMTPSTPVITERELITPETPDEESSTTETFDGRLLTAQFTIDQMSLEVQSRGRSVAELQVSGVTAALTRRPTDIGISLTVHGLLLVDALQTFGPDFELLVASHRHVGMDSMSGSLRDSEPTSPTSPGSPDPSQRARATSPIALTRALSGLAAVSPPPAMTQSFMHDTEALISVEFMIINGNDESIHLANIQFNNLDIIANQETIVELVGFLRRVSPKQPHSTAPPPPIPRPSTPTFQTSTSVPTPPLQSQVKSPLIKTRTEITFDFHRLSVLLLRGAVEDGRSIGRKIGTATMCEARIQATVTGEALTVHGSLGGLQVLDLTLDGHLHQRIISVGRDPFAADEAPYFHFHQQQQMVDNQNQTDLNEGDSETAFSFDVRRILTSKIFQVIDDEDDEEPIDVTIQMASVWYTHSPQFLLELHSCASEFKQYLADVARSIRSAATDVALGLVHARTEALARLGAADLTSPRRLRRRSTSSESNTPYTPLVDDGDDDVDLSTFHPADIRLNVVLDTPVVVLPRSSDSSHVFVAHLGKITLNNTARNNENDNSDSSSKDFINSDKSTAFNVNELPRGKNITYWVEVRDMNMYTLDTTGRRTPGNILPRIDRLYNCSSQHALPVLHDTLLRFQITWFSAPVICPDLTETFHYSGNFLVISGCVVNALRVSLTRAQYEQLLGTLHWLGSGNETSDISTTSDKLYKASNLADISEEDVGGVSTLSMDPHVRAKLFPSATRRKRNNVTVTNDSAAYDNVEQSLRLLLRFDVASFNVELCDQNGSGLVGLSFGDFLFTCKTPRMYETNMHLSLRSLLVEDLLAGKTDTNRCMIASHEDTGPATLALHPGAPSCISHSCPEIFPNANITNGISLMPYGSLPDYLDTRKVLGAPVVFENDRLAGSRRLVGLPRTPRANDLVLVTIRMVDPVAPDFESNYNCIRKATNIDFGAIDVVVNASSWVPLLEFFSSAEESETPVSVHSKPTVSDLKPGSTQITTTIHSLTLVATRKTGTIARARVSNTSIDIERTGQCRLIHGELGALHITHGYTAGVTYPCHGERFVTIGERALEFKYTRPAPAPVNEKGVDAEIVLDVSPFVYVHTKRFIAELKAFFTDFDTKDDDAKKLSSRPDPNPAPFCLSVRGNAAASIILVPVRGDCPNLLIFDVGRLIISNEFTWTDLGIDSFENTNKALLDITTWRLHDVNVFVGEAFPRDVNMRNESEEGSLLFGDCVVRRKGGNLLGEKYVLEVRIDKNLTPTAELRTIVADMTTHCRLSTLDITLDVEEYALIRGILSYNLGEDTEFICPSVAVSTSTDPVWTLSSVRIELLDVRVRLRNLACVNFVRSRLTLDSYSDLSSDVDLVSRQILITDERPQPQSPNVFVEVLRPGKKVIGDGIVQAEIHSRRRKDLSKFTVLLNNMRVMMIPDWWRSVGEFIFAQQHLPPSTDTIEVEQQLALQQQNDVPFEFKLNITTSEVIVVENASKLDTNAIILRSTTLVTYRPNAIATDGEAAKPLSCSVNHLELFSCQLLNADADEETALSIIDPVTVSADLCRNILDIQLHELVLRVSYRDLLMFAAMFDSLGRQQQSQQHEQSTSKTTSSNFGDIHRLTALGFAENDCAQALQICNGRLDDAALWLTQNAKARMLQNGGKSSAVDIRVIEVRAGNIRLCLIDDCGDVDVPLAEATLTTVCAMYELAASANQQTDESNDSTRSGTIECAFALDYYNRVLGGWEPFIESWRCRAVWRPEESLGVTSMLRHRFAIHSEDVLDVNVTDTFLALLRLVRDTWTKDKDKTVPRWAPRSPFVPFRLHNNTGTTLFFATVITEPDEPFRPMDQADYIHINDAGNKLLTWTEVLPGETIPFSYGSGRSKQRHKESHRLRAHQLAVRVYGWHSAAPVTVDRVGVYFRHAAPDRAITSTSITAPRPARLVFDVRLDGSARKLVTVRSALVLINRLPDPIDVKLVERSAVNAVSTAKRTAQIQSGAIFAVPLNHAHSHIYVRPSDENNIYSYSHQDVLWSQVSRPGDKQHLTLRCTTNRGTVYYMCAEIRRERFPSDPMVTQPAHTILLLPALLLVNLLLQDMHYAINIQTSVSTMGSTVARGRIPASKSVAISTVDLSDQSNFTISVHIDNFRCESGINLLTTMLDPTSSSLGSSSSTSTTTTSGEYSMRIRLEDTQRRRLLLNSRIEVGRSARIRVTLSAPYWIINRTGLPLVFRQEGVSNDAAGQFEEHEVARMVAPLLFSFADQDASPTLLARIGTRHRSTGGRPHWCQQFHLRRGIQVRRLRVSPEGATGDYGDHGGPETVYVVGIEVSTPRGNRTQGHRDSSQHHWATSIVTISPRHQLHNRSDYTLEFAQSCHATTFNDPAATAARVNAPPGCHVPFHWPRLDRDQLLCVRCLIPNPAYNNNVNINNNTEWTTTAWTGGLRIDSPLSCHLLFRDAVTGIRTLFLHVEIVPQGATYCVVFSDATALPPPLRVDNCSEVAVTFAQHNCTSTSAVTVAHAHRSVPYAWDEPAGATKMVISAPGGASAIYDIIQLGRGTQLTYENFIYVAFTGTFNTEDDLDHYNEADYSTFTILNSTRRARWCDPALISSTSPSSVRLQRLVLDVPDSSCNVVLAPKQPGKRSQLWRMTSTGQLQHEGSTSRDRDPLVLDIETPAPQPSAARPSRLALRRSDPRRRSTQTWRFTAEGRLCCAHRNTCVQAQDGLLGIRPGSAAVLDVIRESAPHRTTAGSNKTVPLEQLVGKQRMRPGSGLLAVEVTTDGPTRVLRVTDMKQREPLSAKALADDEDWHGVDPAHRPQSLQQHQIISPIASELQVTIMLRAGLGISIIGKGRELLHMQLNNIIAETVCGSKSRELCVSVQDAQCDNQLPNTECPVLVHAARARTPDEARRAHALPVLEIRAEVQPTAGAVVIFKHLIVCVRPLAIHLEETLLLRMYEFLLSVTGALDDCNDNNDEDDDGLWMEDDKEIDDEDSGRMLNVGTATRTMTATTTTRYHFGIIRLVPGPLRLSVHTAAGGSLPARLRVLKRRLGLTLVGFEDAPVELEPYLRHHPFETASRLQRSVVSHFRDELLWQAAAILGSVDFLGSPLGLLGDVSEGVSGLIRERSVGALVLNVAHGLSNSAAKVTETLGDGLGRVTMDDAHEEMRQRIRRKHAGSGGEHIVAGIKGLGFGLLGGATGIFKQIYEGAANDGIQGVFSGLGKGLVGAVAKPVVGVLDLATETARAVRDSSRGAGRTIPERRRQPRVGIGPGGLLPPFSVNDSRGQAYLRALCSTSELTRHGISTNSNTDTNLSTDAYYNHILYQSGLVEQYVAYECVRSGSDDLRVIVSSERVRVVTKGGSAGADTLTVVTEIGLGELTACTAVTQDNRHYIEMVVSQSGACRRPRIRCDTEQLARTVIRQINYAKRFHEEAAHTLRPFDD